MGIFMGYVSLPEGSENPGHIFQAFCLLFEETSNAFIHLPNQIQGVAGLKNPSPQIGHDWLKHNMCILKKIQ